VKACGAIVQGGLHVLRFLTSIALTIGISLVIAQVSTSAAFFGSPITFVACFLAYGTLNRMRHAAAGRCPKCKGKGRHYNGREDGYDRTLPLPKGVPFIPPESYSQCHACQGSGRLHWEEEVRARM
jgi:hypothetical protein